MHGPFKICEAQSPLWLQGRSVAKLSLLIKHLTFGPQSVGERYRSFVHFVARRTPWPRSRPCDVWLLL